MPTPDGDLQPDSRSGAARRWDRWRRAPLLVLVVVVFGVAATDLVVIGTATVGGHAVAAAAAATAPLRPSPVTTPAPTPTPTPTPTLTPEPAPRVIPAAVVIPASTMLAAPIGSIPTYAAPDGAKIGAVGTWYGYKLVLPVIAQQGSWLQVRLPWRPNESTAWVEQAGVTMSSTPYHIVVDLSTEHLTVYDAGRAIMDFPVGTGLPATPTVTGHYFVAVHEPHADPLYGPVILDTSAHSDAIQSWEGAGDAIIAIHGPIDSAADTDIGTTGARVSNGCIRLHDTDLTQLSVIPTGTPVDIDA